ncbi:hypothetical protein LCGC14_1827110 [marine sediment metagenome]|uniref:Uncharacterized protein n=1 Tax=marine sediment metagenome TaxID=412755 RepID=A0A0F9IWS9_9ZZZZ
MSYLAEAKYLLIKLKVMNRRRFGHPHTLKKSENVVRSRSKGLMSDFEMKLMIAENNKMLKFITRYKTTMY